MIIVKNFSSRNLKDYQREIENGGKFVIFQYAISIIFFTFKEESAVYLIRGHESGILKGIKFTLITFFLGWWGIPWGPIYTIQSLGINLGGGTDVTHDVMDSAKNELNPLSQYQL